MFVLKEKEITLDGYRKLTAFKCLFEEVGGL